MTEEKYNPMKLIDETFKRRLEKIKELTKKYDELFDYVKPFLQSNKEMLSKAENLRMDISVGLAISDLVFASVLIAHTTSMNQVFKPIPLKVKCQKCGTVIYDCSELSEKNDD